MTQEVERPRAVSRRLFLGAAASVLLSACSAESAPPLTPTLAPRGTGTSGVPEDVLRRAKEVPVFGYHQVQPYTGSEKTPEDFAMRTPPELLRSHLVALRDNGYSPVSGTAMVDYLEFGSPTLPDKSILLTFDDGTSGHFDEAMPILQEFGFVATFFILTMPLDSRNYLSSAEVKEMHDSGMTIGSHTASHARLENLDGQGWGEEIRGSRDSIGAITGQFPDLFAYPYGFWSAEAVRHVADAGYRAGFSYNTHDAANPLLTLRRMPPLGFCTEAPVCSIEF